MMRLPRFLMQGDRGMVIEFGQEIHHQYVEQVRLLMVAMEEARIRGVDELIPTYRSLLVRYQPLRIDFYELQEKVELLLQETNRVLAPAFVTDIPVCYDEEFGPDLLDVANHAKCSAEEVIQIHTSADYLIYMLGFTPGFPYLGGLSEKIACPRLSKPRTAVPAGSVGIAETQTGIYPLLSPGGWRIIGKTPLRLFDPQIEPPVLLRAGDYLRFVPISREEYLEISKQVESGFYSAVRRPKEVQ